MWRFSAPLNDREPPIFFPTNVKNFTVAVLGSREPPLVFATTAEVYALAVLGSSQLPTTANFFPNHSEKFNGGGSRQPRTATKFLLHCPEKTTLISK
jgi:hypothetical protein